MLSLRLFRISIIFRISSYVFFLSVFLYFFFFFFFFNEIIVHRSPTDFSSNLTLFFYNFVCCTECECKAEIYRIDGVSRGATPLIFTASVCVCVCVYGVLPLTRSQVQSIFRGTKNEKNCESLAERVFCRTNMCMCIVPGLLKYI